MSVQELETPDAVSEKQVGYSIRPGYKQTDVGLIPEDWKVHSLGELSDPVRGGSPRPAGDPRFFNGAYIPWLTVAALTNIPPAQMTVTETSSMLTEEGSLRSRILHPNTLIIANSGATLGVAKILGIKCCANDGIAALLKLSKAVSNKYLAHYINTRTEYLREVVATGNGQPNLNTDLISDFKVPLPPTLMEQEAIAEALGDADALVESLERLLAKKRNLKQAAMQQLLTGKKRLPGFDESAESVESEIGKLPGGWIAKPLRDVTTKMTNGFVGTAKSHYTNNNGVLYIQGYNVKDNRFDFHGIKYVTQKFNHAHMKSCLQPGDLLTVQTGDVGVSAVVSAALAGSNCHALIISRFDSKQVDSTYISYYFNSEYGRSRLRTIETGTTMKHLNVGDMLDFFVPLPNQAEQAAIATVLSDMDAEIAAIEAKIDKARQIKAGMMQELLTGRTRLN